MSHVFEYVYVFKTSKRGRGIIRADSMIDAIERVQNSSGDLVVGIKRAVDMENVDYGYIMYETMRDEVWGECV